LIRTFTSDSEADTKEIAKILSGLFKAGDVVLLEGNLGSGKTFLVKQICQAFGIQEEITSPTFTLIQQYSGPVLVNHMDFYRIEQQEELDQLGWEDLMNRSCITFIEWPDLIEPMLKKYFKVNITMTNERRIFALTEK